MSSIEDIERLEHIRETLKHIENTYNCSETKAISIALNKNLLPDEEELLQARLDFVSKDKNNEDNER